MNPPLPFGGNVGCVNAVDGSVIIPNMWIEHTTPQGRKYYYNTVTKISQWDKPDELKTPEEKASPWREYVSEEGKKYYFNVNTRISTWEIPPDYNGLPRPQSKASDLPKKYIDIASDKLEEAFIQVLYEKKVDHAWSWEQVLRETVSSPAYRAIDSMQRRKNIYLKYLEEKKRIELQEAKELAAKIKDDFIKMLKDDSSITGTCRYRKICDSFCKNPAFIAVGSERERERIFDDYVYQLRLKEREIALEMRQENMKKFASILKTISQITYYTRWRKAIDLFRNSNEFLNDRFLRNMDMIDLLSVYENHIRSLEKEYFDKLHRERQLQRRNERKSREKYKQLLNALVERGKINFLSKWKDIYRSYLQYEKAYIEMLGIPGSSPQDLFFDLVDSLQQKLNEQRILVEKILANNKDFVLLPKVSTFDDFQKVIENSSNNPDLPVFKSTEKDLRIIFDQKIDELNKLHREELKKEHRIWRKKAEGFKLVLKHLYPPITPNTTWEEVRETVKGYPEYEDLEDESKRVEIFQKRIRKLKRKMEDEQIGFKERTAVPDECLEEEGEVREEGEVVPHPVVDSLYTSGSSAKRNRSYRRHHRSRSHSPIYSRSASQRRTFNGHHH